MAQAEALYRRVLQAQPNKKARDGKSVADFVHSVLTSRRRNRRRALGRRLRHGAEFLRRRFPVEWGGGKRLNTRRQQRLSVGVAHLEYDPRPREICTMLPERNGHPLAHIGLAFHDWLSVALDQMVAEVQMRADESHPI